MQTAVSEIGLGFLGQLRGLAVELQTAMGAIASHSLAELEASVARQEELCASLREQAASLSEQALAPSLRTDIRTTTESVRRLNLEYGALLRHSGRSIALLAALCRTTGNYSAPLPEMQHTVSMDI